MQNQNKQKFSAAFYITLAVMILVFGYGFYIHSFEMTGKLTLTAPPAPPNCGKLGDPVCFTLNHVCTSDYCFDLCTKSVCASGECVVVGLNSICLYPCTDPQTAVSEKECPTSWLCTGLPADLKKRYCIPPITNCPTTPCPSDYTCSMVAKTCLSKSCTPSCTGKVCGSDGCGGSCGSCTAIQTCTAAGVCQNSGQAAAGPGISFKRMGETNYFKDIKLP